MAVTWEILDIQRNPKNHAITVVFREHEDGKAYYYAITKAPDATKADYLKELKEKVLRARALRARIAQIKAAVDTAQLEAFINS
jgi:hypothetical protein